MLDAIRNASKSWVAYLLIGLLIISFGIWGISDFLGMAPSNEIAHVGNQRLTPIEFTRQYRFEKKRLEDQSSTRLSREQTRALGLHESAMNNLLDKTAVAEQARAFGLNAGDSHVEAYLKQQPGLTDATGKLDVARIEEVARNNDMTRQAMYADISGSMLREQITNTLLTGANIPAGMAGALNHVRRERRILQYVLIDPSRAGEIKDPTQQALAAYYKDNSAQFEKPETREITLFRISTEAMAKSVDIKDADIEREYNARKGEYVVKEKRTFQQIRFKDEAAAKDGAARLAAGESFEAVALKQGMKTTEINIGEAVEGDPSIPAEAFKPEANLPTPPLRGPFGWVIMRATQVSPGSTKTLADVREELRSALALKTAKNRVFSLSNTVNDFLGGGGTLEEAVKKDANLTLKKIPAITRDGKGAAGETLDGLPIDPEFLTEVFAQESGSETTLNSDGDGGYYVARIDRVTAKRVPPLADIRDAVLAAWRDKALNDKLKAIADGFVARGAKGETIKALASGLGASPLTSPGLSRTHRDEVFSESFVERVFAAKLGSFVSGQVASGKSYLVAWVERVDISNDAAEAQITPLFNERLRQSLASDIVETFTRAARAEQGAKMPDEARMKTLIEAN